MKGSAVLGLLLGFFVAGSCFAQVSPDCRTAVPICSDTPVNGGTSGFGEDDFNAAAASGCLEETTSGAIESNSAWYRFRASESGQLGFNIGFDPSEDWDFALYKADSCNELGEPIRCNFFDNRDGERFMGVGESPDAIEDTVLYEDWLEVAPGEEYYLLINNFSNTNSGFSIQFTGSLFEEYPYAALDCSIISNLLGPPVAACDGDSVTLDATTTGATAYHWYQDTGSGFTTLPDSGSTLGVVTAGFYRVVVEEGDGVIISDVQVDFSPVPMTHELPDIERCDGDGPVALHDLNATALGDQDPEIFRVSYHLSLDDAFSGHYPLPAAYQFEPGLHTVFVRTYSASNPKCFDASREFEVKVGNSPAPELQTEIFLCENEPGVWIGPEEDNPQYSYRWSGGETTARLWVTRDGTYELQVTDLVDGCVTTYQVQVVSSLTPVISQIILDDFRTSNRVEVRTDQQVAYLFQLDDGPLQEHGVFEGVSPGLHELHLVDPKGCGTYSEYITVVGFLPVFTPNGDGQNERWRVEGLEALEQATVSIFDRYGRTLAVLTAGSPGWDGTYRGEPMPESDYWFRLSFHDARTGKITADKISNHFSLKRN